jgi:hypothetical protein
LSKEDCEDKVRADDERELGIRESSSPKPQPAPPKFKQSRYFNLDERNLYQKEYRAFYKEKLKAYHKKYNEAHKEQSRAYRKKYRESHKKDIKSDIPNGGSKITGT